MAQLKGAVGRKLTERELIIVKLMCDHCLNTKEIARQLNLSDKTVTTHRSNIFRKRGVHNIAALCREYWCQHFIDVENSI